MNRAALSRKAIACCILACLALMFAASFHYLTSTRGMLTVRTERGATPAGVSTPDAVQDGMAGMSAPLSPDQSRTLEQLMARLQEDPENTENLLAIGEMFMQAEDWTRAQVFLSRAMISSPSATRPRYLLAVTQYRLGDMERAAEILEGLLELAPETLAQYNLALLYKYQLGKTARARELFEAVAAAPEAPEDIRDQSRTELQSLE